MTTPRRFRNNGAETAVLRWNTQPEHYEEGHDRASCDEATHPKRVLNVGPGDSLVFDFAAENGEDILAEVQAAGMTEEEL